jgi:hypothetical protein
MDHVESRAQMVGLQVVAVERIYAPTIAYSVDPAVPRALEVLGGFSHGQVRPWSPRACATRSLRHCDELVVRG